MGLGPPTVERSVHYQLFVAGSWVNNPGGTVQPDFYMCCTGIRHGPYRVRSISIYEYISEY